MALAWIRGTGAQGGESGGQTALRVITTAAVLLSKRILKAVALLDAPDSFTGDLEAQVRWIFTQTTADLTKWRKVIGRWHTDLFCEPFLERDNRGLSLSPVIMKQIGERGIELAFDIRGPDDDGT